jgi:hypothetical protein
VLQAPGEDGDKGDLNQGNAVLFGPIEEIAQSKVAREQAKER